LLPPTQYGRAPDTLSRRRDGVALIIVLAFVVIITGVILAFFSRALSARAISNASASQTKADLLAQGAADDIIGDLQAEIVLSSSSTPVIVSGTLLATLYTPPPGGSTASMLPQIPPVPSGITTWAPNFLLRSANGQNFYTGSPSIAGNAAAVSSITPSLNGHYVSMARWNSHYLLPLASSTDSTPLSSGTSAFAPPDWVLVTRNGQPASNSTMATSATNGATVIGRYAYAVYHEGGLLDANVAGYPSTSSTSQYTGKSVLSYADLTQLPGGLYQNQAAVDQLVAWRNYASAQVTGSSYQNPGFNAASAAAYYNFVTSNPTGFLAVSSTGLNNNGVMSSTKGQSDRLFASRQQLIAFFKNALPLSGSGAPPLDALNYLATFTRGLDQPSVSPDPTRPTIQLAASNGGNNAQGQESSTEVTNPINPSFLTVRVSGAFTRADGSTAVVGEPLVKKRFALSKIAWLTYLGPSANRVIPVGAYNPIGASPGVTSVNYDLWALVNLYGIPLSYLQQGTAANIQNYFGLVWQVDAPVTAVTRGQPTPAAGFHDNEYKWYYAGHNNSGGSPGSGPPLTATSAPAVSNSTGAISRLVDIAALGSKARDPDFFELLKAAVAAGSKAKGSMSLSSIGSGNSASPYYYQVLRDTSLDFAILQLGANIIDQFKVDGYSTRIVFNDGSGSPLSPIEVRGVENLPYMYRFQSGMMKLRLENPIVPGRPTTQDSATIPPALVDSGVGLVMQVPVIWNPHDENAPPGYPGVTGTYSAPNLRLVADSVAPNGIQLAGSTTGYNFFAAEGEALTPNLPSISASITAPQITASRYTTGPSGGGTPIPAGLGASYASYPALTPSNSALLFQVPGNAFFREPTPLSMAGLPKIGG
jgi:hypothetical protein